MLSNINANNPVDKNRSTTGGQSGPSYLQLWLQKEDSLDHANWEDTCFVFLFHLRQVIFSVNI